MSNEPKCPICGGDLIKGENFPWFYSCQSTNWKSDADEICELDDCAASVPVWEALRRTRKALDVAVDEIKKIKVAAESVGIGFFMTAAIFALAKIKTALEQKDK